MFQAPVFWANTAGGDPAQVIARGKCFLSHIGPLAENVRSWLMHLAGFLNPENEDTKTAAWAAALRSFIRGQRSVATV